MTREPKGAILPLGGEDLGHKGFALALLVEMLTASLGGFGRADQTDHWGASVFLQVIDPAKFGGLAPSGAKAAHLPQSCRTAKAAPRQRRCACRASAPCAAPATARDGVDLHPDIGPAFSTWADEVRYRDADHRSATE